VPADNVVVDVGLVNVTAVVGSYLVTFNEYDPK